MGIKRRLLCLVFRFRNFVPWVLLIGRKTLNASIKCLVPHLSEEDRTFAPVFGLQVWNSVLKSQM